MSMPKHPLVAACLLCANLAGSALAEGPHLGKPIGASDLKAWDIFVMPDGTGLPRGSGTAAQGAPIYKQKCAACHGENGEGAIAGQLIGGPPRATLDGGKTISNYYPYATTIFDYVRRAMPYTAPRSLSDQEVYALTAFLLARNKIIGEDEVMNAETLPKVKMPNRDGFITRFPDRI
ncbi:MAG TPA: cytochrome c [Xanthobacteraceae bacterium]|nr:cytochrome c [Xanthobacteraceae bacterium]